MQAAAAAARPRPASERSPQANDPPAKQQRSAVPQVAKSLFQPPQTTPIERGSDSAQQKQQPAAIDEEQVNRVFSTPDGQTITIPARYAASDDDRFSYKTGHLEGRSGKDFKQVFDGTMFRREPFFDGFSDGVAVMRAEKAALVRTPALGEVRTRELLI